MARNRSKGPKIIQMKKSLNNTPSKSVGSKPNFNSDVNFTQTWWWGIISSILFLFFGSILIFTYVTMFYGYQAYPLQPNIGKINDTIWDFQSDTQFTHFIYYQYGQKIPMDQLQDVIADAASIHIVLPDLGLPGEVYRNTVDPDQQKELLLLYDYFGHGYSSRQHDHSIQNLIDQFEFITRNISSIPDIRLETFGFGCLLGEHILAKSKIYASLNCLYPFDMLINFKTRLLSNNMFSIISLGNPYTLCYFFPHITPFFDTRAFQVQYEFRGYFLSIHNLFREALSLYNS